MAEFSYIETQVIQSLLATKPVDYIAMIVDKPAAAVEEKIRQLLCGSNRIAFADRQRNAGLKKKVAKENKAKLKSKKTGRIDGRAMVRVIEKKFSTRQEDYSKLRLVRVDSKTSIYAKPGEDPEECRKHYLAKMTAVTGTATAGRYVEVKKFK
jgi:hypothetical protein